MMSLHHLACALNVGMQGEDVQLLGATLDSRKVQPGFLYIAMQGEVADGHDYISSAISRGAVAVVCERQSSFDQAGISGWVDINLRHCVSTLASTVYQHPSEQLNVIGITGTNGKTSVSYYLLQALRTLGHSCGQIGTLGLQLNDSIVPTINTTPDAFTLQQFFSDALREKVNYVAMEVSSHALDQGRVNDIDFSTAVFTNLTHDHLDYHETMDAYFEAKAALFKVSSLSAAVINVDDIYGQTLTRLLAAQDYTLLTYSLGFDWADVHAKNIQATQAGMSFDLIYKDEIVPVQTQLIGRFNVSNLLALVSVLLASNFSLKDIVQCLPNIQSVKGRMEVVTNDMSVMALVDYAHTPDALKNVLLASQDCVQLQRQKNPDAKLITVFGCGGDRDKEKRPLMAKMVEKYSDINVVTADNPRSELQSVIAEDIVKGFSSLNYVCIDDREKAIEYAVSQARVGDTILLAGKGHEDYQLVSGKTHFFSDVECLSSTLAMRAEHV